ncbi:SNARE-binding exocyst subunit SEC6 [Lachancea thermotolerans CBS 6340]|uniref:KLTH0A04730p n=1 Tax=Lachancea thermotolerans (strain ATCC 56472 / CBS 6340 / NRRL Y-8284) TaxID=559295 RepID=C5DBR3_LACTC|nr:KLTH0A04730p [Lachancea thermotolerans CBS 6340]CAR21220.1 KLTH0A04730p [Lachancea thermotolerans CBS 6340]
MADYALQRVSELIKDEPSIDRIRELVNQITKEKSTIDYQLNKDSKKSLNDVTSSLDRMHLARKNVRMLKDRLREVSTLSQENQSSIERYEVINEATAIHELIEKTTSMYNKIIGFNDLLTRLSEMMDNELAQDALQSGIPNLLQIHYLLTMARDFHDQSLILAQTSTEDVQRTMQRVFQRLPELIQKFDRLLESLIFDIVEAVRTENQSLLIRLFKIIDLEDREDIKIEATRRIIESKEREQDARKIRKLPSTYGITGSRDEAPVTQYPSPAALAQEITNGTIQTRLQPRGYKKFLFDKIKSSIQDVFQEVRREYSGEKRFEVLNNLDWVFNELLVVKDHVSNLCPAHWQLFDKFYELYYHELNKLITELVNAEPETLIILDILDFDKTFQSTLRKDFGFSKDQAKSVIGEKEKETLLSDYLNLIVTKSNEWFGNLESAEMKIFVERTTPPHTDSEGLLFLDGTKTCFQMFSQQVEVAAGSGQAKILVGVVDKLCELLAARQKNWMDIISVEVKKSVEYNHKVEEDPESVTPEEESSGGLVEYLIAVANDQMKAADYAVAISQKYGSIVSKVHEKSITNNIERTLDGFAEVAKCSSTGLIKLMFDDLRKPYTQVFGKNWYTGNQAQQIADTLYEYLGDIRAQMNPFVYSTLAESVIEETILKFVECLKYEHSFKSKHNKFLECMKRDFEVFYKLFVQFVPEEEREIIDDKFKLMEFFMDFSCGPVNGIIEVWTQCLEMYWDCPASFLSAILKCRKDVDSSTLKSTVATAQRIASSPQRANQLRAVDLQPTFISRFKIA